jgi:hypothetical protein
MLSFMSIARLIVLIAASSSLVVLGCRSKAQEKADDGQAAQCDAAHARALRAELEPLCSIGRISADPAVPLAPWDPEPTPVPHDARRIELGPDGVKLEGSRLGDMDELRGRLVVDRELASSLGRGSVPWVLIIDRATAHRDLRALAQALVHAGERTGLVMLATSAGPRIPEPRDPAKLSALMAKVSTLEPSERAMRLAEAISNAMPPCPPLVEAFSSVAALSAEERCPHLAEGFAQGLVACDCPKEDELLTLFYALAVGGEPPSRLSVLVPITLDPEAAPRSGTSWGDIVGNMQASDFEGFWLAQP